MSEYTIKKNYPNVAQSFGITGIVVLGMIIEAPLNISLESIVSKEIAWLICYVLGIGIPFLIVNFIRKSKTGDFSFNLSIKNKKIIPFIIIGAIALLFGIISPITTLIPMPEFIKKVFIEVMSKTGVFAFITMVVAAPILEELIFRGIILDGLLKQYSPLKSILISSLLFGLVHLNPWQFVTGFIIGIFSGWVYYHTRSLLTTIIIHAAVNLSAFSTRYFTTIESSINDTLVTMYGGLTNLILLIIGSIIIVVTCIWFLQRTFIKQVSTP